MSSLNDVSSLTLKTVRCDAASGPSASSCLMLEDSVGSISVLANGVKHADKTGDRASPVSVSCSSTLKGSSTPTKLKIRSAGRGQLS